MRAEFEVPDIPAIRSEGLTPVDMHYHTRCSDSDTDPVAALRLAECMGVGFAVTDHNLIQSVLRLKELRSSVPVVPGMEVSTTDGPHILVYFPTSRSLERFWYTRIRPRIQENPWLALRDCTTERLLDMCEMEDCVVSAAHPSGYFNTNKGVEICIRKGILMPSVARRLDAYEVISGGMTRESNENSLAAAKGYGLGFTGGTDSHVLSGLGGVVTVCQSSTVEGILEDVRHHRVDVIGQEKNIREKVVTGSASAMKFARHVPSTVSVKARGIVRRRSLLLFLILSSHVGPYLAALPHVKHEDRQRGHCHDHRVVPQLHFHGVGYDEYD